MVVDTVALMDGVAILSDDRNLRVTIRQSGKGALICGASCFVGGLVAGPVGMAVGGTLGGLKAWHMSKGKSLIPFTRHFYLSQTHCAKLNSVKIYFYEK